MKTSIVKKPTPAERSYTFKEVTERNGIYKVEGKMDPGYRLITTGRDRSRITLYVYPNGANPVVEQAVGDNVFTGWEFVEDTACSYTITFEN